MRDGLYSDIPVRLGEKQETDISLRQSSPGGHSRDFAFRINHDNLLTDMLSLTKSAILPRESAGAIIYALDLGDELILGGSLGLHCK